MQELDAVESELTTTGTEANWTGQGWTHSLESYGSLSDRNAHPYTDESGRVTEVHNEIIENYQTLRDELQANGVTFESDTDTEVIPKLTTAELDSGADPETAVRRGTDRLREATLSS